MPLRRPPSSADPAFGPARGGGSPEPFAIGEAPFWPVARLVEPDAWAAHVPFAFWIVAALKPRLLVELGTHSGNSYLAFCQAVQNLGLATACFAVDTWSGDAHAGLYGEDIYDELVRYHDPRYGAFSRLVRSTFEEATRLLRGRERGPPAHRRAPYPRGGRGRFRAMASEALDASGGPLPRHQRAGARVRRLAPVGGAGRPPSSLLVPARPRTGGAGAGWRSAGRRPRPSAGDAGSGSRQADSRCLCRPWRTARGSDPAAAARGEDIAAFATS